MLDTLGNRPLPGRRLFMASLASLMAGVQPAFANTPRSALFSSLSGASFRKYGMGEPVGVVLTDFSCPYCRLLDAELARLTKARPGHAFAMLDMPLLGQGSVAAAKLEWVAGQRGKAMSAHAAMMSGPRPSNSTEYAARIAAVIGEADMSGDAASPMAQRFIDDCLAYGRAAGVTGVPAIIFVDGTQSKGWSTDVPAMLARGTAT